MAALGPRPVEKLAAQLRSLTIDYTPVDASTRAMAQEALRDMMSIHLCPKAPSMPPRPQIIFSSSTSFAYPAEVINVLEEFDNAVFLFADMKDFTRRSEEMAPGELATLLNRIYSKFQEIITLYGASCGIEIVKLTADCIMLCASSHDPDIQKEQAIAMVEIALHLSHYVGQTLYEESVYRSAAQINDIREEEPIKFRFGIHMGPAAKIMITLTDSDGQKRESLDWVGKAVNKASRMESSGVEQQVQISKEVYDKVKDHFELAPCRKRSKVKSFPGEDTYFVIRKLQVRKKRNLSENDLREKEVEMPGSSPNPGLRRSGSDPTLQSSTFEDGSMPIIDEEKDITTGFKRTGRRG